MWTKLVAAMLVGMAIADPKIYLKEQFNDGDDWESRWVQSKHEGKEFGRFVKTAGKWYGDKDEGEGIQTSQDARFYGLSTKFDKFSNADDDLVIQFQVKHEQTIDCGGGYVKLFPSNVDQVNMHGESPYNIMFGPDICGPGTKKVHVIFNYKGNNLLIKKDIRCKDDDVSHVYTLIVKSDNTYIVKIDNKVEQEGSLEEDWDFLLPKKIKDPEAKKPDDWDDRETIADPEDEKPEDWEQPEFIPDNDATRPEDWDDEMDGEWEPPQVNNPEFKGEWKPKQIPNPDYSGKWVHPEIDNPDYVADDQLYKFEDFGILGLDLWQVKSGTIFDNFLITNDAEYAAKFAEETWGVNKEAEQKMKDDIEEADRKRMEAEAEKNKDDDDDENELEDIEDEEIDEHDEL